MQKEILTKKVRSISLKKQQQQIKFYRPKNQNGYLSNFYPAPFAQNKKIYKTSEHYFQSKKYEGKPQELLVIDAQTPGAAFKIGRNKKFPRREDWEHVKQDVMYQALKLKFNTHKQLKQKLLETGKKEIIEHTFKDSYWADGGNGNGKNRLGVLLMRLRDQFIKDL